MMTLANMKVAYRNSPKVLQAIERASALYGDGVHATIALGRASRLKGSNCWRAAKACGFNGFAVFEGARRRYRTEGFVNVVVEI